MRKPDYLSIQADAVRRYRIDLCDGTRCENGDHGRMHAHIHQRRVCKWKAADTVRATFDLFHEIGHIESNRGKLKRAEQEWLATCWVIDRFRELGLEVPLRILFLYQRYILLEVSRGLRRYGTGYRKMNLYEYAGTDTPVTSLRQMFSGEWWCEPEALDIL